MSVNGSPVSRRAMVRILLELLERDFHEETQLILCRHPHPRPATTSLAKRPEPEFATRKNRRRRQFAT
jgi:hypothetical protein